MVVDWWLCHHSIFSCCFRMLVLVFDTDTNESEVSEPEQPSPLKNFCYLSSIVLENKKEQASFRLTTLTTILSKKFSSFMHPVSLTLMKMLRVENESNYPLLGLVSFQYPLNSCIKCPCRKIILNCWPTFLWKTELNLRQELRERDHVQEKQLLPLNY